MPVFLKRHISCSHIKIFHHNCLYDINKRSYHYDNERHFSEVKQTPTEEPIIMFQRNNLIDIKYWY